MDLRSLHYLTIILFSSTLPAAEIGMRGTLQVINCSVNNGKPMDVNFGDAVGVNKVDGVRYRQPLAIEIVCSQPPGELLHLTFAATSTDFDPAAVATNVSDLGIRLLQDEIPIEVNKALPLDEQQLPHFFAVPVKRPESQLTGGAFSAMATLLLTLE